MLRRCGGSERTRSYRRTPTSSLGTSVAPRTGQRSGGRSVASTARSPPTSESSQNRARSSSIWMPPSFHPAGTEAMHGTNSADGTDWALRIIRLPVPHVGVPSTPRSWAGVIRPAVACTPNSDHDDDQHREPDAQRAPSLERDPPLRRRQRPEAGQQVTAVLLHDRTQLGGARDTARGGERLADLLRGEEPQRVLVHAVGVGAHREHQHHVGEIDGLAPR